MTLSRSAALVFAAAIFALPALAEAQEPVRDFSQLNTRLRPGDTVWVTDAQGREVKGEIGALEAGAITFRGRSGKIFAAPDVSQVTLRQGDSLLNGALIGMGVGGGAVAVMCLAGGATDEDWPWCAAGALLYAGVGTAVGIGIDALIPGKKLVVYRAPGAGAAPTARLSVAPIVTPLAKGVAVSFSF